jgi:outer membrane beta-barrel protein
MPEDVGGSQADYEKSSTAIVRNKKYYKKGAIELTGTAGLLPYDSLYSGFTFGGRLTWHLHDHYGWEVVDALLPMLSVSSYTHGLISNIGNSIANMQASQLKTTLSTNFLLSPFYGKLRFFGSQVMYFDIALVLGGGVAQNTVSQFSYNDQATVLATTWDPLFTVGLSFKLYMSSWMGLSLDLRDYMVLTNLYSKRRLNSNFAFNVGLSFFIPPF